MSNFQVHKKHILVTGASSGIGAACAHAIAENGGHVILSGRDKEKLEKIYAQLPGEGHSIKTASLPEEIEPLVESIGEIDGLVFSAGVAEQLPIKYLNSAAIQKTLSVNLEASMLLCQTLIKEKRFRTKASLVFISSIAANFPYKGGAIYASSKAGLEAFSKTLALELAHKEIRSNCIAPAMVKTPMFDQTEEKVGADSMDAHAQQYPLGLGEPLDVANAALFLLSDASKWMTGQCLTLDGGLSIGA